MPRGGIMDRRQTLWRATLVFTPVLLVAFYGVKVKADEDRKTSAIVNGANLILQGQQIFRFDTFGDQAFWGDMLKLHQAIEGAQHGGVGPGLSPAGALMTGLKMDADA